MTTPAVIQVGTLHDALEPAALRAIPGDVLAAWLGQRRWFGAKSQRPRDVSVGAVVPVSWPGGAAAIVRLDVDLGDAGVARYQVPLTVAELDPTKPEPAGALARIDSEPSMGVLVDATGDAGFRRAIAGAFAQGGARFERAGARWIVEPLGDGVREMNAVVASESRVGSAEQSNTSIVFGDRAILKLFRRLETGESPDVELTRVLTIDAGFRHTPALLGVVRLETPDGAAVAGMLQRYAHGSADAWGWILEAAKRDFASGTLGAVRDAVRSLGAVTRAMHEALASGKGADVRPEPATRADVRGWAASATRTVEDALALLEPKAGALPGDSAGGAREILGRRDEWVGLPDRIAAGLGDDAGQRIRHHGDYHLGQVLRAASGEFLVIDFEGEPARPLSERRARSSALRDVAGMLRSFAYAAATLAANESRGGAMHEDARSRAERWEREARATFLEGYFAPGAAPFLPRERRHADALVTLFETEKVFYELSYELNNRPDWVWIPLAGIARLRADDGQR